MEAAACGTDRKGSLGRIGGGYDLSRLLKRARWGGGSGRNVSERGCSVADIVANIDDPLGRGSRFREVGSRDPLLRISNFWRTTIIWNNFEFYTGLNI